MSFVGSKSNKLLITKITIMEIICKVEEIGQLQQRAFTDRNNQQQQITERQIKLRYRGDLLVGRMVGHAATNLFVPSEYYTSDLWVCNLDVTSRLYMSDKGEQYFTDVKINTLTRL